MPSQTNCRRRKFEIFRLLATSRLNSSPVSGKPVANSDSERQRVNCSSLITSGVLSVSAPAKPKNQRFTLPFGVTQCSPNRWNTKAICHMSGREARFWPESKLGRLESPQLRRFGPRPPLSVSGPQDAHGNVAPCSLGGGVFPSKSDKSPLKPGTPPYCL